MSSGISKLKLLRKEISERVRLNLFNHINSQSAKSIAAESVLVRPCPLGRFTFTKVVRIIMDIGLSVALMSEKEKFEVSSSYSIGKHPNCPPLM